MFSHCLPIDKDARIYIKHSRYNEYVYFGIESFSGKIREGKLYGGIYIVKGVKKKAEEIKKEHDIKHTEETLEGVEKTNNDWWPIQKCIYNKSLKDTSTLINLHTNENEKKQAINAITETMIAFITQYKDNVFKANEK